MVAVGILAVALTAILAADSAAVLGGARMQGLSQAALLVRGVVMDIEAEYQEDGFPTNSLYGRRCDVPREFRDQFKCEYDLIAMEFDPGELQTLVEQGVQTIFGGGAGGEDEEDDRKGDDAPRSIEETAQAAGVDPNALASVPGLQNVSPQLVGSMQIAAFAQFAAMLGIDVNQALALCNVNPEQMIARFMAMSAFFPMIVQEAANVTRKLTVRLTWDFGPKSQRELAVTTFIIGLPEEEIRKMEAAEDLQSAVESALPFRSPDGGVPPSSGGGGGGGK